MRKYIFSIHFSTLPFEFQLHPQELLDAGKTQAEVAELFGVSANTIGRKVREKRNRATDD